MKQKMTLKSESLRMIDEIHTTLRSIAKLCSQENELLWSVSKQLYTLGDFLDPVSKRKK